MTMRTQIAAIGICLLAGIPAVAAVLAPYTNAATGAPDVTDFTKDSIRCGGGIASRGFNPRMEFGGLLETTSESYLRVTSETETSFTMVQVDNVVVQRLDADQVPDGFAEGNYYRLPAWDGRPGYQPILYVSVTGVAPSDDVAIDMAWVGKTDFAPIASGQANESCTLMGNPIPDHQD